MSPWNSTSDSEDQFRECFLARHPDARSWLPGQQGFHGSRWWQFNVEEIYMIGGFGDRAFIGYIPVEEYHSADILAGDFFMGGQ